MALWGNAGDILVTLTFALAGETCYFEQPVCIEQNISKLACDTVIVERRFIFFLTYLLEYVQIFNWHNGVWGNYFIQNSSPFVKEWVTEK